MGPPHSVGYSNLLLFATVFKGTWSRCRLWQSKTSKPSGLSIPPCLFSPLRSGLSLHRHKFTSTVQAGKYEEFIVPSWLFSYPWWSRRGSDIVICSIKIMLIPFIVHYPARWHTESENIAFGKYSLLLLRTKRERGRGFYLVVDAVGCLKQWQSWM